MKTLIALLLLATLEAGALPRGPSESLATVEWEKLLVGNLPVIVRRILAIVWQHKPVVIRFGPSEGESVLRFDKNWDIFNFKFGQGRGGLLVLLSGDDEDELARYFSTPGFVGRDFAEDVRWNGLLGVTSFWGCAIEWGRGQ